MVSKRDLLQTSVNYDAEDISTDLLSSKRIGVYGTSSDESNWVGYPVEENIEGGSHELFDVSGDVLKFSLQTRELLGNYWGIKIICISGIEIIVFEITSPSLLTLYFVVYI